MRRVSNFQPRQSDIITYAGAEFAGSQTSSPNGGRVYMLVTTADTVKDNQTSSTTNSTNKTQKSLFYRTDIGSKASK